MNEIFQRGWFGTFAGQPMVAPPRPRRACDVGEVYDIGPFDGLRSTSIWAQHMAQMPLVNYAQQPVIVLLAGHRKMGAQPVFCEAGHIPVPTGVPGQSRCVPYSPPSGMIGPHRAVRTFPVGPYYGQMSGASDPRLGQGGVTLTQGDRDVLVNQISAAVNKVSALEDLIVWSGDYDPNLRIALGIDATRFFTLSNSIASLFPQVKDVLLRISDPDPEFWVAPSTAEDAAIRQWTTGVNEMHRIYMAHKGLQLTLPPGVPPPPGFTFTSPTPATQIIQPRPPAGAQARAGVPVPIAPQGPTTTELLIGGGLALGLGLLISVVVA